jgi:hypothetical protein
MKAWTWWSFPSKPFSPDPRTTSVGATGYAAALTDGRRRVLVAPELAFVRNGLRKAEPPPSRPGSGAKVRPHPQWPPAPLGLPAKPVIDGWKVAVVEYLGDRGGHLLESWQLGQDVPAALARLTKLDGIAALHVRDLHELFALGASPREADGTDGSSAMLRLLRTARDANPSARIIALDFRAIARSGYSSHAARLVWNTGDVVLGPFFRFRTLQAAVRLALGARELKTTAQAS